MMITHNAYYIRLSVVTILLKISKARRLAKLSADQCDINF